MRPSLSLVRKHTRACGLNKPLPTWNQLMYHWRHTQETEPIGVKGRTMVTVTHNGQQKKGTKLIWPGLATPHNSKLANTLSCTTNYKHSLWRDPGTPPRCLQGWNEMCQWDLSKVLYLLSTQMPNPSYGLYHMPWDLNEFNHLEQMASSNKCSFLVGQPYSPCGETWWISQDLWGLQDNCQSGSPNWHLTLTKNWDFVCIPV